MKNSLFLRLSQFRIFWAFRALVRRFFFWIEANLSGAGYKIEEEKTNLQSLRGLFQITQTQLFLAVIAAIVLQIVDPYLYPFCQSIGLRIPDDSDYVTLLATVSGIGGVFIGLYYAGICTVSGAIYSRVPNNIRDLLVQERIGYVYMRYLGLVTFIGLALIGLRVLGYPRIFLAVPTVALMAGIGIIAFVKLGQRAFNLFDPTALSYHIFVYLRRWLKIVKVGGFKYDDPSFQVHANKQAGITLDALETLADITAKEQHLSGKPFLVLTQHIIGFLIHYEKAKRFIPSASRWYQQSYVHRDWYRTEESSIDIAYRTGTSLQPEITGDKYWVERKVLPIIMLCIRVNLKAGRYSGVLELLGYIDGYLKVLAKEGWVKKAFEVLSEVSETVIKEIALPEEGDVLKTEVLEKLALSETIAYLPISIFVAFSESLDELSRREISERIRHIQWSHLKDIYRQKFPSYCIPRLEWLKPRLTFELSAEGRQVSPLWYQTELLMQVVAEQLVESFKTLVSDSAVLYKQWINHMNTARHPWLGAAILSREWEYWHKAEYHLPRIIEKWTDINGSRYIEGLPWPDLDMGKLSRNVSDNRNETLKHMSQQGTLLALLSRPNNFPDYAGQFLHCCGETVFEALYEGNHELLKAVFRPYFVGCLFTFDKLRPKTVSTDWRAQQEIKIAAAPLLDLMDLSGYSYLFADYHDKPILAKEVTDVWNEYLDKEANSSSVKLFAIAVELTEAAFEIPYRGILRTTWQRKVSQRLMDLPRKRIYHRGSFTSDTIAIHKSPLVRIFAREPYGSFNNGVDIFIALFLCKRDAAKDIEFGWRSRELSEEIKQAEKNYQKLSEVEDD
jgi:hypothetical protein